MQRSYITINLNFADFYDNGTLPEGDIFTFSKNNHIPTPNWKIAHWKEIGGLLIEKYFCSQREHQNCGLLNAARSYFSNHIPEVYEIAKTMEVSLVELSLVIEEGNQSRIFIPNLSITHARQGKFAPHTVLEDFFNSDSFGLIRNITQYTAANPAPESSDEEQTRQVIGWVEQHAAEAKKLLTDALEFHPNQAFVEGVSPAITLKELGHPSYKSIAQEVILKRE